MKLYLSLLVSLFCLGNHGAAGELDPGPTQQKWFEHYRKQKNVPKPEDMLLNTQPEPPLTQGFTDLFNGKDLTGWQAIGGTSTFEAKDGAIRGVCVPGSPSTYLYTTEDDFADFIFTCELRWEVEGNTGVMFRAGRTPGKSGPTALGPQMEMEPPSQDRDWSGGIYGQGCGGWYYPLWLKEHAQARTALKSEGWNRVTIEARGPEVRTWLNGVPIAYWKTDQFLEGAFGLQIHAGQKGAVLWRNLKVKKLDRTASERHSNPGTPWPATDALSRSMPDPASVSAPREDRFIGIFYFLWHNRGFDRLPNDISKILPLDPDILKKPDSPLWGGGGMYYWGEPLYGYYDARDPWVIRRHANLLVDAGVDTVIFDTTNRRTYPDVYMAICRVWSQILKEGGRTPRLCFMVNTKAGETADELFRDLYQPGLYSELWFRWHGKPLLICDPEKASDKVKAFFTLRKAHWPFTMENTHNAWHWEATYPQPYGYHEGLHEAEQINVSVAQNLHKETGKVVNMSSGNARGRSYHDGNQNIGPGSVNHGYNAAEQWGRAFELDPPFVMITGWNEWIAGKYSRPNEPVAFVDQFDQEFSRDIEPVKGLHGDNYYYQMVNHIRRYKGAPPLPKGSVPKTIRLDAGFAQWNDVRPEFTDHAFDTDHRDFGKGEVHYTNTSGRNDIVVAKVARDSENVYFYAQTREPLTPNTDPNWMWLLIDVDANSQTGWEGYDFILNRTSEGQVTLLEECIGNWKWKKVSEVQYRVDGNELMIAVSREALGLTTGNVAKFDFKWWDNARKNGDIMDTYLSGDTAPDARFNYRYVNHTPSQ